MVLLSKSIEMLEIQYNHLELQIYFNLLHLPGCCGIVRECMVYMEIFPVSFVMVFYLLVKILGWAWKTQPPIPKVSFHMVMCNLNRIKHKAWIYYKVTDGFFNKLVNFPHIYNNLDRMWKCNILISIDYNFSQYKKNDFIQAIIIICARLLSKMSKLNFLTNHHYTRLIKLLI